MRVEVAFALPETQFLETVIVPAGATVADAIQVSGLEQQFPGIDFGELQAGIWGKPVDRSRALGGGERIEVYRELEMDPREARRLKAGV